MIQKKVIRFVYVLLLLIIFSACSSQISSDPITTQSHPTKISFPIPETDKAVFAGRVVDMSGIPISNLQLRLAEVYRSEDESSDGAYILDTAFSPGAISDENGYFIFSNIEPMEYVLVLGNPEKVYEIITDESGKAKVWETEANQVLDIGELKTDFDPTEY
jgi:hypothetical protein